MKINRYNEFKYAEEMLESGFQSKFVRYELKILAKYYKFKELSYEEIESKLYEFCEQHMKNFSRVKYFKLIKSIINYVKKDNNRLIIIEHIHLTRAELEYIDNCDIEEDYKRFLFSLLVRFKLDKMVYEFSNEKKYTGKCFSYKIKRHKEVFTISKLNRQKHKFEDILHNFYVKGLIDIFDNGKLRLLFLDEIEKSDKTEVIMEINTISIDDVGLFWKKYKGDNKITNCALCDVVIEARWNRIYCADCTKYMINVCKRKAWAKYKHKYRP